MRIQLNSILCATDFSDFSNQTIHYGIRLAQKFEAKLYVCHIIDLPFAAMTGEVQFDPIEQQNRMIDYAHNQLAELFLDDAIEWEPLVAVGQTADEIDRLVEDNNVDLVVTATHGRHGLKRLLLGSVTERLMRTVTCPLLIVRGSEEGDVLLPPSESLFQRILVGCDFSEDSDLAYRYGLSLAQELEAELHLAHVVEPPIYQHVFASDLTPDQDPRGPVISLLQEKLDQMVPVDARHWCHVRPTLLEGKPDEELNYYAVLNNIDLIVLGVRGHGLVESLFVGSTTDRVVRSAPCPVLAVRPISGKFLATA